MEKKIVYAFIDSQNLNLGVRSQGWKLDFARFRVYLKDKYGVDKALLFIGFVAGNEGLYAGLKKAGYDLVFKPTLEYTDNKNVVIKGNVDAELVLHAMIEYPNYGQAVIVSGDGDFHCLIEYLEQKNKLKRVLVPNIRFYSRLLEDFQPKLAFISNLKEKLSSKREASLRHKSRLLSSRRDKVSIAKKKGKAR